MPADDGAHVVLVIGDMAPSGPRNADGRRQWLAADWGHRHLGVGLPHPKSQVIGTGRGAGIGMAGVSDRTAVPKGEDGALATTRE